MGMVEGGGGVEGIHCSLRVVYIPNITFTEPRILRKVWRGVVVGGWYVDLFQFSAQAPS